MDRLSDNLSSATSVKTIQVEALGQSEAFLAFSDQLSKVAPVQRPVLLIGERGTGKRSAISRWKRWRAWEHGISKDL